MPWIEPREFEVAVTREVARRTAEQDRVISGLKDLAGELTKRLRSHLYFRQRQADGQLCALCCYSIEAGQDTVAVETWVAHKRCLHREIEARR